MCNKNEQLSETKSPPLFPKVVRIAVMAMGGTLGEMGAFCIG
jgi:hypothetical protein